MKGLKLVVALALSMATTSALAIDIRNEDATSHTLSVKSVSSKRDIEVTPHSISILVCAGRCEFTLNGKKTYARGNDLVTIRNGTLIAEDRTSQR